MRSETKTFIAARKPFCKNQPKMVSVKQIPTGAPNQCYLNAYEVKEAHQCAMMMPGWLVQPFDHISQTTSIIAHWWNCENGKHWDTTPGIDPRSEYVMDAEIYRFITENDDRLSSRVCASLLLQEGRFIAVVGDNPAHLRFVLVSDLRLEHLFSHHFINAAA